MPFSRLLKQIVFESGKTQKQIIEECKEKGRSIDKAYFSKLLNGKVGAPSEELAKLLAEVCNYDERKLVLEAYIDKAPREIFELLVAIKEIVTLSTLSMFQKTIDKETLEEVKNAIKSEPIVDFVMQLLGSRDTIINGAQENFNLNLQDDEFNFNLKEPIAIAIKDKGMEPFIKEGTKVSFELKQNYDINDILLIKIKETEEIKARQIIQNKTKTQLIPLNKNYKKEEYKNSDIIILGRVNRIITEL